MKKIAVLGCTGSIGTQTLDIVRNNPDKYEVTALSCGSDIDGLIACAREFNCKTLGIYDKSKFEQLKSRTNNAVFCGDDALTELAACDADIIVVAVVGMIGLKAVLAALKANKTVALANKESLVAGGGIVKRYLERGGELRPVDSEHSAVWQCMHGENNRVKRIILTASGGPFYFKDVDLDDVTPEQAIAHPNWKMGKKISVDSATMMNKGLEIIEARWLFDTFDIDYIIHPESVVHSMIEFEDGSIKAQASYADMRLPIQYALAYPNHDKRDYKPLTLPLNCRFFEPDEKRFPAPRLAKAAIAAGGSAPVILNAANEAAVRLFLERKIKFTDIVKTVQDALDSEPVENIDDEESVYETHKRVYDKIYLKVRG